jgi:isopenicillin-N N-acyltransferase-like protein
MAGTLQVIEASGSHYDMGFQIGRQTREQTRALAAALRRTRADDSTTCARHAEYMRHVEQFPFIMDELRGMADGAGLPFEVLARIQVVELDRCVPKADGCTTLVVRDADRLLIGHNEDGGQADDVFLLKAAYPSGLRLLALCYIGSLAGHAPFVNSHGLVCTCNALRPCDSRVGEPKRVFCRRVVDAADIDEAVELLGASRRAQGENFVLAQGGRAVGVEASATAMRVEEIAGNCYHCNNYLHTDMVRFEGEDASSNTFTRSAEAQRVCGELRTMSDLHAALSSHANHPRCFCRHDGGKTLACAFFDCTEKRILIGHGPPCRAELEEFTVDWQW